VVVESEVHRVHPLVVVVAEALHLVLPLRYVAGQREQPWKRGFLLHLHG
jgi:hypothetical protein